MPGTNNGRAIRLRVNPPLPRIGMTVGKPTTIQLTWIGLAEKNEPMIYVNGMAVNVNGQDVEDGRAFALETVQTATGDYEAKLVVVPSEEGAMRFTVPVTDTEARDVNCTVMPCDSEYEDDDEDEDDGVIEDAGTESFGAKPPQLDVPHASGKPAGPVPVGAVPRNFLAADDDDTPLPAGSRADPLVDRPVLLTPGHTSITQALTHPELVAAREAAKAEEEAEEAAEAADAAAAATPKPAPPAGAGRPRSLADDPFGDFDSEAVEAPDSEVVPASADNEPTGSGPKVEPTRARLALYKPSEEAARPPLPKPERRKNGRGWMTYFAAFGGIVAMIGIVALLVVGVHGFKKSYESMRSAQTGKVTAETVADAEPAEPAVQPPSEPVAEPPAEEPTIDEAPPLVDADDDGFAPTDAHGNVVDCDDNNAAINPRSAEVCGDTIDQDCDGADLDCNDADVDRDGYSVTEGDCDDANAEVHPSAEEKYCDDGVDQNCDGADPVCADIDYDQDGYSQNQGDCDDEAPAVSPAAAEVCGNGVDEDCDGKDLPCPAIVERLPLCPNFAPGEHIVVVNGEVCYLMACDDGTKRACPVEKTTTLSGGHFSFDLKDCTNQP